MMSSGLIGRFSAVTPTATSSPAGPRPPTVAAMASALFAVASTTAAPPSFCSSAATSCAVESM